MKSKKVKQYFFRIITDSSQPITAQEIEDYLYNHEAENDVYSVKELK